MNDNHITLYASSWLYNASVVGFLYSLEEVEGIDVENSMLEARGAIYIQRPFFFNIMANERYFGAKKVASIVGKSTLYRNYLQANQRQFFLEFINALDSVVQTNHCDICGVGWSLNNIEMARLNQLDPARAKFLDRISHLSIVHNSLLGPSINEFPNAFWSLKHSPAICHLCSYLLIHHHLALTRLSDGSEIFINAPSFKVMFELNKLAKELFGNASAEERKDKRDILAMSVIEYAARTRVTLGTWLGMNLEVVSKKTIYNPQKKKPETQIEFFSLPSDVVQLISDRNIAALLSEIGEFKILNLVLKQEYSKLPELAYRLLRESLADQNKRNDKFINDCLHLWRNKGSNLGRTAEMLLRLYALIEQKQQRSASYGNTSVAAT